MIEEPTPAPAREQIEAGRMRTLDAIPEDTGRRGVTCLHSPRNWSPCYSDGYRYCTNCWRVRVRC